MEKLGDYGFVGIMLQIACVILIPMLFVLTMIFLPVHGLIKLGISVGAFLLWGCLRQESKH